MQKHISVINIPEISAIYFALLQCGYDYYAVKKDATLVKTIEKFHCAKGVFGDTFFSEVKQNTCEVYPYWPRAAVLETTTFFLDSAHRRFRSFDAYRKQIMFANNISDAERNRDFWKWIEEFPSALCNVLSSQEFQSYLLWENEWIDQQNRLLENDLFHIQKVLSTCAENYASPIQNVSIVLNPIKCAYSADYHITGNQLFFCAGAFQWESVVHEFLHHAVHPLIAEHKEIILQHHREYPDIDASYYLAGDEHGRLNAFEEYLVRKLTALAIGDKLPSDIEPYIRQILSD